MRTNPKKLSRSWCSKSFHSFNWPVESWWLIDPLVQIQKATDDGIFNQSLSVATGWLLHFWMLSTHTHTRTPPLLVHRCSVKVDGSVFIHTNGLYVSWISLNLLPPQPCYANVRVWKELNEAEASPNAPAAFRGFILQRKLKIRLSGALNISRFLINRIFYETETFFH